MAEIPSTFEFLRQNKKKGRTRNCLRPVFFIRAVLNSKMLFWMKQLLCFFLRVSFFFWFFFFFNYFFNIISLVAGDRGEREKSILRWLVVKLLCGGGRRKEPFDAAGL